MALLILIPPLLSLQAIYKGDDREERALKTRVRKALLRKELNELKEFDQSKSKTEKKAQLIKLAL